MWSMAIAIVRNVRRLEQTGRADDRPREVTVGHDRLHATHVVIERLAQPVHNIRLHDLLEDETAQRLGVRTQGARGHANQPFDVGSMHAGNDVGGAFGVDADRGLRKRHAEGRDHRVGRFDGGGDRGRVADIADRDLEPRVFDRESTGPSGEGDDVMIFVECHLGEQSACGAIGPEHCELHRPVPFDAPGHVSGAVHQQGRRRGQDCDIEPLGTRRAMYSFNPR